MGGPYLNSLIPIVAGVAASAWAPMRNATTPTVTTPSLYARALVSSFMVLSFLLTRPNAPPQTSFHAVQKRGWTERIAVLGVSPVKRRYWSVRLPDRAMTQRRTRMSERLILKEPRGPNPAWLAVPLVGFALITLTVGLVAGRTVREPYATPFFHPFFADTL